MRLLGYPRSWCRSMLAYQLLFVRGSSGWWKVSVDRLSGRQLALALAATFHSFRGTQQPELAAHALSARPGKIGDHVAGVMLDEGVRGAGPPVRPTVPSGIPGIPQRADGVYARLLRNLIELAFVRLLSAIGHRYRGFHISGGGI